MNDYYDRLRESNLRSIKNYHDTIESKAIDIDISKEEKIPIDAIVCVCIMFDNENNRQTVVDYIKSIYQSRPEIIPENISHVKTPFKKRYKHNETSAIVIPTIENTLGIQIAGLLSDDPEVFEWLIQSVSSIYDRSPVAEFFIRELVIELDHYYRGTDIFNNTINILRTMNFYNDELRNLINLLFTSANEQDN